MADIGGLVSEQPAAMPLGRRKRLHSVVLTLVGTGRVGQFVAVRVDFDDVAEGIFAIDHSVRFFTGEVLANWHALLATVGNDPFGKTFHIRVLNAEVKHTRFPIFKIVGGSLRVLEFEDFDADLVAGRKMSDSETSPTFAEDVVAHDTDGRVIRNDFGRRHDDVPAKSFGVELNGSVQVGDRKADVRERAWICHGLCPG